MLQADSYEMFQCLQPSSRMKFVFVFEGSSDFPFCPLHQYEIQGLCEYVARFYSART